MTDDLTAREAARKLGLKRYFTGQPCKRGHVAERFVGCRKCCVCSHARTVQWQAENPEKQKAVVAKTVLKHRDQIAAKRRIYVAANKEKVRAAAKRSYLKSLDKIKGRRIKNKEQGKVVRAAWLIANREKVKAQTKAWNKANKDKLNEYYRRWRDKNPEKVAQASAAYRAATKEQRRAYRRATSAQRNAYATKRRTAKLNACPKWLSLDALMAMESVFVEAKNLTKTTGVSYHVDHIVPLLGQDVCGLHVPWNLRAIPAKINLSKNCRYDPDIGVAYPSGSGPAP